MRTPPSSSAAATVPDAYELARELAQHMTGPAPWMARPYRTADGELWPGHAELERVADGAAISVVVGGHGNRDRVVFRAQWPRFHDGRIYTPREHLSITCSALRAPRALARELERRLLVDYAVAYREALAYVRASDAAAGEALRAAERVARAIGATMPTENRPRPRYGDTVALWGGPSTLHALKVQPPCGESPVAIRFEVHSLDEATALRVFALLAEAETRAVSATSTED